MNTTSALALSFAIGVINGLRSMTAPAILCWAVQWKWLDLQDSRLAFIASPVVTYIVTAFAIVELVIDKLPKTPSRKAAVPLIARIVLGGFSGAVLCVAANQSAVLGAVLGGPGGVTGAYVGYEARTRLVRRLRVPDFVIAILEDAVAIGGGLLIVSRF
jgi:uncharacterized membrane protein